MLSDTRWYTIPLRHGCIAHPTVIGSGEGSDGELFNMNPNRPLLIISYLTASGSTHLSIQNWIYVFCFIVYSITRRKDFTRCEFIGPIAYLELALMGRWYRANNPPYKSGNKRSSSLFQFPGDLILYHLVLLFNSYPLFASTINLSYVTVAMATIITAVTLCNAYFVPCLVCWSLVLSHIGCWE